MLIFKEVFVNTISSYIAPAISRFGKLLACAAVFSVASLAHAAAPTASSDSVNTSYQVSFASSPSYVRIFLDTDKSAATGYSVGGAGASYMLENGSLYRYTGSGGASWGWTYVKAVTFTKTATTATVTVARADIGSPKALNFVAQTESPVVNSALMSQTLSTTTAVKAAAATTASASVSYSPSSALIANPERGFYGAGGHCEKSAFSQSVLQGYRTNDANTLVICVFYLSSFKTAPINATTLNFFQKQMDTVRAAGLKVLVRFAYTESTAGDDASLSWVKTHLDQLAPYFAANSDVMFVTQQGLIGAWGEGAFSNNFGTGSNLTAQNVADRTAVLTKLLQVVPANRMVQVRTPLMKTRALGSTALSAAEAFSGSNRARVGHHNDCFLHGATDSGTYLNTAVDYPYLAADSTYLPVGGETCGLSAPRTDCPTALSEMAKFHWSYLNLNFDLDVVNGWRSQGCFNQIKQSLGYRFVLQSGSYSTSGKPGATINVSFTLKNVGWAAPFNARNVQFVLRNTATGALVRLPISTDPRLWLGGNTISVSQALTLPASMASGTYAAFLSLPDSAASLAARPEYAIQFANTNMWEAATGLNNLNHTMAVAP